MKTPVEIDIRQRARPRHRDFIPARPIDVGQTISGAWRVARGAQNFGRASDFAFAHQEIQVVKLAHRNSAVGGHRQRRPLQRQRFDATLLEQRRQPDQFAREMEAAHRVAVKGPADTAGRIGRQGAFELGGQIAINQRHHRLHRRHVRDPLPIDTLIDHRPQACRALGRCNRTRAADQQQSFAARRRTGFEGGCDGVHDGVGGATAIRAWPPPIFRRDWRRGPMHLGP